MDLFDLHCDTPLELYRLDGGEREGGLHITKDAAALFGRYRQLAAFCAPPGMSDGDGYSLFFRVAENFRKKASAAGFTVGPFGENFTLTVEDARILGGDISRLDALIGAGVSLVTPLWGGTTCIGGAHDTDGGLTEFGRAVVEKLAAARIPVDVSHASVRSADEITDILGSYGMPPIATHSNAYALCPHTRNLRDGQLERIGRAGGLVGVSLYPPHLSSDPTGCTAEDAARHIEYYAEKLGPRSVALGCDFDGIGSTPKDIKNLSELPRLYELLLRRGMDEETVKDVFSGNAERFFERIAPTKG